MRLGDIFVALRADDSKLKGDLDNAKGQTTSWASGLAGSLKGLIGGAVVGGIGALVAGVGAVGVAAFNAASEVDSATDRIESKLGIGAEQAAAYGEAIKGIYGNNFGESIADVEAAVTATASAFQRLGDVSVSETQKATEQAIALRDAYGVEVVETTRAAAELMDKFGISSQQSMDFITSGFQKGLNASDDFLDSIGEYSTQFANGGADAGQFFSLLESGLQGGMLGTDKAADAFKEFRLRVQDGSKTTADGLALLGINAEELNSQMSSGAVSAADAFQIVLDALRNTEDPLIRMQAGAAVIGTQFEDLGDSAVAGLSLAQTGIEDLAGATDKLNKQYDNLPSFFEGLRRRFVLAITPIGDALLGVFNDSLPTIEAWFSTVEGWITNFIALSDFTWEPDFKQIKLGDLFEWVTGSGVTQLTLGDFFDLTTTPEFTTFTLGDFFSFATDAGKTEIDIGEYVSFYYDKSSGGVALTVADVFTFTTGELGTAFNLGDYISFFYKEGEKFKLKIGDVYELEQDANSSRINLADWLIVGYEAGEVIELKVGDFYTIDKETGKSVVKVGDFYTVEKGDDTTKFTLDASWFFSTAASDAIQLKVSDFFDLVIPTEMRFGIKDFFNFGGEGEDTKVTQADLFDLETQAPVTKFGLGDFFTWMTGTEDAEIKITAGDLFDFSASTKTGITKFSIGDFINFETDAQGNLAIDGPDWDTIIPPFLWETWLTVLAWPDAVATFDWASWLNPLKWPMTVIDAFSWDTFLDVLAWPTAVIDAFGWGDWVEKLTWPLTAIASFAWSTFVKAITWPTSIFTFSWSTFVKGIDLGAIIPAWPGWAEIFRLVNPFGDAPAPNVQSDGSFGEPEEEPFDPNSGTGSGFGRSSSRPTKQAATIYIENVYVRDERDADMFAQTLAKRMAFG